MAHVIPLFKALPSLALAIPRIELLSHTTPLEPMNELQAKLLAEPHNTSCSGPLLWVKRDDTPDSRWGGNKARKLEFLLADARHHGATTLVTSGMYGSNHALATALIAQQFGMKTILTLGPQPITEDVKKTLLAMRALGAELRYSATQAGLGVDIAKTWVESKLGKNQYFIPPGGSTAIGGLGYANAFLELQEQFKGQNFPERIVLPIGSGGTTAGLLAGICLAGMWGKVRVEGVGVTSSLLKSERDVRRDAQAAYDWIKSRVSPEDRARLPQCDFRKNKNAFRYVPGYFEPGYGAAKPEVHQNIEFVKATQGLQLEPTYSGKAMTYLLDSVRDSLKASHCPAKTVFIQTYRPYDLDRIIASYPWSDSERPWKDLPPKFWPIFEIREELQLRATGCP
ncbi:pyridoxal-phosphate dependent enzyme [Bdellovibrionota bacterium FG-1]